MDRNKSQFELNWEQEEKEQRQDNQDKIDKNKIKKCVIPIVVVLGLLFIVLFSCGITKKNKEGDEKIFIHTEYYGGDNISTAIIINDEGFTWYHSALGGWYFVQNAPYTIDKENHLIYVEGSEFPFYYNTDNKGKIIWIARLVGGNLQEIHYLAE